MDVNNILKKMYTILKNKRLCLYLELAFFLKAKDNSINHSEVDIFPFLEDELNRNLNEVLVSRISINEFA